MANIETSSSNNSNENDQQYQAGVRNLCEKGIARVPVKYILPESDRPEPRGKDSNNDHSRDNLKLPVVDFAELQGPNKRHVVHTLGEACQQYGFFQLINHGIEGDVVDKMGSVCKEFFELPFEERSKYMSSNMHSIVRCGTSFNQNKDKVFCWRDFLKLTCHPLSQVLPHWPASPPDLREAGVNFSSKTKALYLILIEAIMESLGLVNQDTEKGDNYKGKSEQDCSTKFEDGSQIVMINYYPSCPEPDLTLGMPPHSDYGFLTLLLQDEVEGLQIHHGGRWVTVEPRPNSFVVNVGDHLEIFSNGRYKSVLHRAVVNSLKPRMSIASLHSLPLNYKISPSPKLIDEVNPKQYKDTDYSSFLEHISTGDHKNKSFLDSRKLTSSS